MELHDSFKKRVSSEPPLFLGYDHNMTAVTSRRPTSSRICTEGGKCWVCVMSGLGTERFVV